MVAPPRPATASTRPPIGYDTMDGDSQVRAWLALFGGQIATADYADEMIAQGWDSLENMIFSADDLMDAMPDSMKQGHANRIARDAVVMLENIGDLVVQVGPPAALPPAAAGVGGVDSMKLAGAIPQAPSGDITREVFMEWLGRLIPWLRIWSKELADALADRRDNPALKQAGLLGKHGWDAGDNIYFGSLLLTTMGRDMKVYLDQSHEDASEGIDMMCIMIDRYAKVDDSYLLGLQDKFRNQHAVQDISELSNKLATWRSEVKVLQDKGLPQNELTQKGSLLKVVSRLTEIQACVDSVEVMQKGRSISLADLSDMCDRFASRAPNKSKSNDKNKNNNDKNKDKNPHPKTNPKNDTPLPPPPPPPPIMPIAMVGGKSKRPCLAWGLKGLPECAYGAKCSFAHDPDKCKNNHADTLKYAKSIPCRSGTTCTRREICYFKHDDE